MIDELIIIVAAIIMSSTACLWLAVHRLAVYRLAVYMKESIDVYNQLIDKYETIAQYADRCTKLISILFYNPTQDDEPNSKTPKQQ